MKRIYAAAVFLSFCAMVQSVYGQALSELSLPPNGNNQRAEVSQWIGLVKISILYHSPNVHGGGGKDRAGHIWGELIPYGLFDEGFGPSKSTPWRAGANESTTITLSHDVKVEGKDLKAGTYALFLKLEKDAPWVWIFSNNSTGWGSYQYDPKDVALQVHVNPQPASYTEFLTYGFDERRQDSALAFLQWENKRIPFKIEVPNVNELYVAQMRKELMGWPGFNYQNWQTAAQFCADNRVNLEEALAWAEKAISEPFRNAAQGREDFSTLGTKAAVLQAMGRGAEADSIMDRAIRLPGTSSIAIYQYCARLLAVGRKERALEVAKLNQQQNPEEKFWTYIGLARAYTAAGDVNRDGHADLIVGAWQHSSAAWSGGRVYLYSGKDGALLQTYTGRVAGETFGFDATGMWTATGQSISCSHRRGAASKVSNRVVSILFQVRSLGKIELELNSAGAAFSEIEQAIKLLLDNGLRPISLNPVNYPGFIMEALASHSSGVISTTMWKRR